MSSQLIKANPDLTNICVGTTQISSLSLYKILIRGYKLEELVKNLNCFEEICYLLVFEKLPTLSELKQFQLKIHNQRVLPQYLKIQLQTLPKQTNPQDVMKIILILLETFEPETETHNLSEIFIRLLAVLGPGMFYCCGYSPNSTFTIRVVQSANCSIYQALQAAMCSWQGLRHGQAATEAMKQYQNLLTTQDADHFIEEKNKKKQMLMGFGHKYFKPLNSDVRLQLYEEDIINYILKNGFKTNQVVKIMDYIKDRIQNEKKIYPNADFYLARFFAIVQLEPSLISPLNYLGRFSGQFAHFLEQRQSKLLFCPNTQYVGSEEKFFIPLSLRSVLSENQVIINQQQQEQQDNKQLNLQIYSKL